MSDERLASEAQRQAAEWVRGLPEETPNLAWRAALNEKVRAEAGRKARRRLHWTLARPALGLVAATALALVVVLPRGAAPRATPRPGRLEAGLVALYDESVRTDDIVGTGLRPSEEAPTGLVTAHDPLDDLDAGVL